MNESKPQLLFLDDDLTFLEMLENIFTIWSEGRCEIHIAENAGKALGIIQRNNIDLVAVDLVMPVLDGIQFIGLLNRKYPNLLKVALSGSSEQSKKNACFEAGAELFLEKPSDIESMRSIFSTMESLALAHRVANPVSSAGDHSQLDGEMADGGGFRGMMRVGLSDIVQMECLARNSSILQVKAKTETGKVFIEDGEIIHAEIGTGNGVDAFNKIMALKGGEFKLLPFQSPGDSSIEGSWEFLLMEAARLADEQSESEMASPIPSIPGKIPSPESDIPAPGIFPPAGGAGNTDLPRRRSRRQNTSTPLPSNIKKIAAPEIAELLITNDSGKALHEWQTAGVEKRANFLELVKSKSRQMSVGLPLGNFNRLIVEAKTERVLCKFKSDWKVFVRVDKQQTLID